MGSRNGGWLLVVGFLCLGVGSGFVMFPICGRSSIRALWSPYSVMWVVNHCVCACVYGLIRLSQ